MNIYFDTEFTGLVPNTTLISIGCIAETGEKFYAEFTDYNKDLCDDWINENVIDNLLFADDNCKNYKNEVIEKMGESYLDDGGSFGRGTTEDVRREFTEWLKNVSGGESIQFISDVCHYDFYLLCNQIFGGAFNLPENVNPVCYDICQDIRDESDEHYEGMTFADTMYNAFDFSREDFVSEVLGEKLPEGKKHNSLYDAEVIKIIFEYIRRFGSL